MAIVDDIHFNAGFAGWERSAPDAGVAVAVPDDERALFGLAVKGPAARVAADHRARRTRLHPARPWRGPG